VRDCGPVLQYRLIVPITLLIGTLSGCATYHKCGFGECAGDSKITAAVNASIRNYPSLEAPNVVRVQTIDHVVYLYGQVDTDLQRLMAQDVALAVPGVTRVVNSIGLEFEGK
jgi:osmotically-inducible protein OsmY